jgi:hypothetical protein
MTGSDTAPPRGNILRIDTRSRQVENFIFPEFNFENFIDLAIGPKP